MRDILFRAKGREGEGWQTGYYWKNKYKTCHYEGKDLVSQDNTRHYLIFADRFDAMKLKMDIVPETLGQYTGLDDKNGIRIFENDIVVVNDEDGTEHKGVIKFMYGAYRVEYFGKSKSKIYSWDHFLVFVYEKAEVIGNIFDNPELLESQEEK